MPLIGIEEHLEGLRGALMAFTRYAERAGLEAPVPTTPDWTVRRLVGHQGMVHRWAAAAIAGKRIEPDAVEKAGRSAADPIDWLRDGAIEVVSAISGAPDDLDALVFLADAPPPKAFWARRQCHETTIHAVDALAAALGRYPVAADTWIDPALALDGIDELLTGFVPRPQSTLRSEEPTKIAVVPDSGDHAWLVHVGPDGASTERLADADSVAADVVLAGPAVPLYLTLWNRSDEVSAEGDFACWGSGAIRWGARK